MSPGLTPAAQGALLRWAAREGRDLPWRRTRDPWAVLVSEVMLQQTQVARVVPRYHEFLGRFPTPTHCAAAEVADVVRAWVGLGYNRRAVHLHRCASTVVREHGGAFPADLPGLLALPGIGPYTARAVMAFAFEADVGIVDTNAARVMARLAGTPLTARQVQGHADAAVPAGQGWAWNQAVLDLGAAVCTKRCPACPGCPMKRWCAWRGGAGSTGPGDADPAIGSAGVPARQSRFEGSDRQGRGRLVDALATDGVVPGPSLASVAGWPDDVERAERVAETLVRDGLARWGSKGLRLAR